MQEKIDTVEKNIGKALREKRKSDKFTQKQVGDIIGASNDSVSKIEKGMRVPGVALRRAIEKYLKTPKEKFSVEESFKGYSQVSTRDYSQIEEAAIMLEWLATNHPSDFEIIFSTINARYIHRDGPQLPIAKGKDHD